MRLRAASFIAKSASMYWCVVAVSSWPSQIAMTVMSTPGRSNCIAVACRTVSGEISRPRSDGHRSDAQAAQSADFVQRRFFDERPIQLWVAVFTYIPTFNSFLYPAIVSGAKLQILP